MFSFCRNFYSVIKAFYAMNLILAGSWNVILRQCGMYNQYKTLISSIACSIQLRDWLYAVMHTLSFSSVATTAKMKTISTVESLKA